MLSMKMDCHLPERHLLPALGALYLDMLPLPVGSPRSRHPLPIRRLRLSSCLLTRTADHSDCPTDIGLQDHPVKQP